MVALRLSDGDSHRRKRPASVAGAILFRFVGPTPPAELTDWTFAQTTNQTTPRVSFPGEVEPGSLVWMAACWLSPTLERGPTARPVSTHVAGWGAVNLPRLAA